MLPHASYCAAALLLLVTILVPACARAQDNAPGIEKLTISRNDTIHECFPSLCRTSTGRVILAYRESDEHQPRKFTNLVERHSDDNGATWSERRVLVETATDTPNELVKYNCPKVQQLKDGRLLYLCDRFVNDLTKSTVERYVSARIVFWFSDDNGETWSEEQSTDVVGVMPDEVIELEKGDWLLASQLVDPETGCIIQYVSRSPDKGTTWGKPKVVAARDGYDFCEASILKCPDGLLICYMRENKGLGRPIYKCFSEDGGRTWSEPYTTLMDGGHRPVVHLTRDGRVLVTYRYYPGRGARMRNTFVCREPLWSAKESDRTKQVANILPLDHDRHERPDSGYTGWVEIADGEFFAVNYTRGDAPMAFIRGYRFTHDDF